MEIRTMSITYSITTDDKALYDKLVALATGAAASMPSIAAGIVPAAAQPVAVQPPSAAVQPAPMPAAAVPTMPAPAPVVASTPAPVAAAAPAAARGEPQPGWTIEHVRHALAGLASNPAKGPAAVQALLQKYGANTVADLNPAQWHLIYQDAQQV